MGDRAGDRRSMQPTAPQPRPRRYLAQPNPAYAIGWTSLIQPTPQAGSGEVRDCAAALVRRWIPLDQRASARWRAAGFRWTAPSPKPAGQPQASLQAPICELHNNSPAVGWWSAGGRLVVGWWSAGGQLVRQLAKCSSHNTWSRIVTPCDRL